MGLIPTRGPLFVGLNALRTLSIIALMLVFAATVVTIVDDLKAVKAAKTASGPASHAKRRVLIAPTYESPIAEPTESTVPIQSNLKPLVSVGESIDTLPAWFDYEAVGQTLGPVALSNAKMFAESSAPSPTATAATAATTTTNLPSSSPASPACDYYTASTVPTQAGGTFWSVLSRIAILAESTLLLLSELTLPPVLFATYIPMLGPGYGTGALGVLQALIASSVLAHHCTLFAQISAWLLFLVALANILVGIFMRDAKARRSLSWENAAELTPQTRAAAGAWHAASAVNQSVKEWKARNEHETGFTDASGPSFYSQNTPAPTVAPTVAPAVPRNNRFSWETVRSPMCAGRAWGLNKDRTARPVISRPLELGDSVRRLV
ncbi:hypothetical protein CspeluHIS016_0200360 [Cutaneotrichosporon spelunceum]|uniref:Uncharacterized protein n=1 Tax=Cutaneotrichosporon spelunceum TaxID=1672016 RepID=A0AAD3Y9G9_9TREE|nr:hypothetical protein CspeluHIS016_0200360 [Cutaneotrichosporon spelunceum]